MGHALLKTRQEDVQQPITVPAGSLTIVADAVIHNRAELSRQLRDTPWLTTPACDAALLLAGYERWQTGILDRANGDFAFLIYDGSRRVLFAARDPFGVKPLFFSEQTEFVAFASEPKQLLALPGVAKDIDDLVVGEYLFKKFEDVTRTFHRDVKRLTPASYLIATRERVSETRYWNPDPLDELSFPKPQDYLDRFRTLLRRAVRNRTDSDFAVVSQLSGGLDSSCIAITAAELYRQDPRPWPDFVTASATFRDLACDESSYINALRKTLPFSAYSFCPLDDPIFEHLHNDYREIDSPFSDLQRGTLDGCTAVAAKYGARTLLTGLGGDELLHEEFYLRDLALRRKRKVLVAEAWRASKTSWNSFGWLLRDAVRPITPNTILTVYRCLFRPPRWVPPPWVTEEFAAQFAGFPEVSAGIPAGFRSLTQQAVIEYVNYPGLCWALEALECQAAHRGFSVSHPYLDRPLVEFILKVPFEQRLPGGCWKYFLVRGFADALPASLVRKKTRFDEFEEHVFRKHERDILQAMSSTVEWHSARYVNARVFRSYLQNYFASSADLAHKHQNVQSLWRVISLELWRRFSASYTPRDLPRRYHEG